MCGIIGYVGKKDAKKIIISGLKSLEYRGYDSSGIAYNVDNKIRIVKTEGKVENLEKELLKKNDISSIGIGHTRWATHGKPTKVNAHPHKVGKVTLVHNGIIENYIELKDKLKKLYRFQSDTDTEVAAALIDFCINETKNKLEALKMADSIIRGSFAFAIIFDDEPNTIYGIRRNSPLIIAKCKTVNPNSLVINLDISSDLSEIIKIAFA